MSASKHWAGLELRHLLALQAIATQGSFHKAAAHLDYTQSGVSQQINALERIVGEQLIERPGGSRPVRLTASGEIVLRHARTVLGQITAARADVLALRAGTGGTLRVGAFQSIGGTLLPPLMRRLAEHRPEMRILLTQTTSDPELFDLLEAGELDVTFAMLPAPDGPFAVQELFADAFVVLVPTDSALARSGRALSLSELAELPLVVANGCRYTSHLETQMRERGFEPDVVHRSDDNGTVQGLVAAGAGVAVVPELVAHSGGAPVTVLGIDEPLPPRRIALSWRDDRHLPAVREQFAHEVVQICSELGLKAA